MDIKELEKQRDKEITGFFWLGLQIALIFGIPAFLAVIIGKKLVGVTSNNNLTIISLVISFIFSWIIVIFLYKKKSKRIYEIEIKIKEYRNKELNKLN